MVVVLVIGILIAIALPLMLGARTRAQDRRAHADLRNGVAAAKVFYTDSETFTGFSAGGTAQAIEPSIQWTGPADPGGSDAVAIVAAGSDDLLIVRRSDSGRYFCFVDQVSGFTKGSGATFAAVDTPAECINGW